MKDNLAEKLGLIIKCLPALHDMEYNVQFYIHDNTCFQKLVSKDLLRKGIYIAPTDFFRSMVALTYYTTVIEPKCNISDNLATVTRSLREKEKDESKEPGTLAMGIEFIVTEMGICSKESGDKTYSSQKAEIKARYDSCAIYTSGRRADPYYMALGKMVFDLVSENSSGYLENVSTRNDIGALVFTDAICALLKDDSKKSKINEKLAKGDFLGASVDAIDAFKKEVDINDANRLYTRALKGGKD